MRFETLHLDGFGIFAGAELGPLSPTLNVIEGHNEAGKSTTLEFIRALLFGFQTGQHAQRYEPARGGIHGGWALVRDRHGRLLRIERRAGGARAGLATVTGDDAEGLTLPALLRGADRRLFSSVFAFSLVELRSLETLQGDDLYGRIYAAGTGTGDASLLDALGYVTRRADELYRPEARERALNRALRELDTARGEVERLKGGLDEYNAARLDLESTRERLVELRTRATTAREHAAHARTLRVAWPAWIELAAARADLSPEPAGLRLPPDAVARLEALLQESRAHREAQDESRAGVRRLAAQFRSVPAAPSLLAARVQVHRACARLGGYTSARAELPRLWQEHDRQEIAGMEALSKLGPVCSEADLERFDTSIASQEAVRAHREALQAARHAAALAAERLGDAEEGARRLGARYEREAEALLQVFPEAPPPEARFAEKRARLEEAREHLEALARCELRLEQEDGELPSLPPRPPHWLAGIPLALAAVIALLLRAQPLAATAVGLLLAGLAATWWHFAGRTAAPAAETEPAARLRLEAEGHRVWLARLQEAPYGWSIRDAADLREELRLLEVVRERRQAYEARLQQVESRREEWEAADDDAVSLRRQVEQLQAVEAERRGEWSDWLAAQGLPAGVSPETAPQLLAEADRARAAFREREQLSERIAALMAGVEAYEAEVAALFRGIGWSPVEADELPAAVRALPGALEGAVAAERERAGLLARALELREEWRRARRRLAHASSAFRELLRACGAESADDLRLRAARQARRDELEEQIRGRERVLETLSAPGEARLRLEAELAALDSETLERLAAMAGEALTVAAEELETVTRHEGRLLERLAALEQEEALTARLRELRAKEAEVAELAERWAVLRLTQRLLEKTRERFESQRQPAVIRRAGEILGRMTGGRYERIVAPSGLDRLQLVEVDHSRKERAWWSRGTAEQLYLALRFAFIEDYGANPAVEPLPVVMDDVLVHSDGYHRLHRSAECIAELAQRHQVLYFTCRPADAELLAAADPGARRFRLESGSFQAL